MNYRAWNHRCWLISYMTNEQVLIYAIFFLQIVSINNSIILDQIT
jgi:hypothetical protein